MKPILTPVPHCASTWLQQLPLLRIRRLIMVLGLGGCLVTGCASVSSKSSSASKGGSAGKGGGYYQNDGPGDLSQVDLDRIPDAVPRDEKIIKATTKPYNALGRRFEPMTERESYRARGEISWYGKQYHTRKTSSGETYDMYAMSAAHPTLPLPSYARVTNLKNGKSVVVRVNDRGPFLQGRILDLSYVAAAKLGYVHQGTTEAEVEVILPGRPTKPSPTLAAPSAPLVPAPMPQVFAPELPPLPDIAMADLPASETVTPTQSAPPEILPTTVQIVPPEGIAPEVAGIAPKVAGIAPETVKTLIPSTHQVLQDSPTLWLSRQQVSAGNVVQTGAFAQASQAETLIDRLTASQKSWPEPNIKIIRLKDDDGKYKVWLAGFASKSSRLRLQAQLKQQGMDSFNVAR